MSNVWQGVAPGPRPRCVDGADLGMLLAQWSVPEGRGSLAADLDGDGVIDGADLGLLLGAWTERRSRTGDASSPQLERRRR